MSESLAWKFKPLDMDDMIQDPVQDEFFKTNVTKSLADALVRETIQNSLDAQNNPQLPVKVKFSISSPVDSIYLKDFLLNLNDHISASLNGSSYYNSIASGISFLVVEDFNTIGLEGDPEKAFPSKDGDKNENFFFFWRNIGRSGKSEKDRGRWGLGKAIFSSISQIKTFFGLTIRASDRQALLMGQSVLKTHIIGEEHFAPYGYYGMFNNIPGQQYFARPIRNNCHIQNFCKTFLLNRYNEPGLSLVIPYIDQEIRGQKLIEATIQQFFYPIIAGKLIVEIKDDSTNCPLTILSRDTIQSLIESGRIPLDEVNGEYLNKANLLKLLKFAMWSQSLKADEYITLNKPDDLSKSPKWGDDLFENIDFNALRQKFDTGAAIAFRIPLKVHRKRKEKQLSWFKVYLQRDQQLSQALNYFIREGITITGVNSFRDRGIRGMVVIDEEPLTTMLGDAENPSHTEWQKDSSKFKDKYEHGPSSLSFVKNSMQQIIFRLNMPKGIDKEVLNDIFYLEVPNEDSGEAKIHRPGGNVEADGGRPVDPPKIPSSKPRPIRVNRIESGITIDKNPNVEGCPEAIQVLFAYNVGKGNPFDKYQKLDFDLSFDPIKLEYDGIEFIKIENNYLKFLVKSLNFKMSVRGFDVNRDLAVKINYNGGSVNDTEV